MIEQLTLSDLIQSKVALGPQNARGFHDVRCAVCSDHSPRGAFKFDGGSVGYTCWNCGAKARYEEGSGRLSRNFRTILDAFGITKQDLLSLRSSIFSEKQEEKEITLEGLNKVKLHTPEVALPSRSYPIGSEGHEELQLPLAEYLLSRKIDPIKAGAHFSLDPKFLGRVIIPFYRGGKVIYWQARHIDRSVKPRYLNSAVSRDAVLYGYDEIYSGRTTPLFAFEGIFDAISLDGVALLGASLNEAKLEILRRTRRRVIFVIDRDRTGGALGEQVLENGWELSFVDPRVKDANESLVRFGRIYTLHYLLNHATTKLKQTESRIALDLGLLEGKLRRKK